MKCIKLFLLLLLGNISYGQITFAPKSLTGTTITSSTLTNGSITGNTTINTTANPVFDAGSGTNTITLRDGTLTKSINSDWAFSSGISLNYLKFNNNNTSNTGGTIGIKFQYPAFIANDLSTAQNGTNTFSSNVSIDIPTLTATNTGVTTTNAANLYIAGPPTAGTNMTITNPYALYVASGNSYFANNVNIAGTLFTSGIASINQYNSANNFLGGSLSVGKSSTATNGKLDVVGTTYSTIFDTPASDASGNGQYRIGGSKVLSTYGSGNVFVVGGNNTLTGTNNTVNGSSSGIALTTGSSNTLMGLGAGQHLTTGGNNTYLGYATGFGTSLTSVSGNTFVGANTGRNTAGTITSSSNNTYLGSNAGFNLAGTTYVNTILLGNDAGNGEPNLSNIALFGNSTTPIKVKAYGGFVGTNYVINNIAVTGTLTIDCSTSDNIYAYLTLTGNVTLTLTNYDVGKHVYIRAKQGGSGSYTITFPGTISTPGGSTVDWNATVGTVNIFDIIANSTSSLDMTFVKM